MIVSTKMGLGVIFEDLGDIAPARQQVSAEVGEAEFTIREPNPPVRDKQQRRHRTGRSSQINIKAKPDTIAAFQAWADAQRLSIAEAFEVVTKKLTDI